MPQSSGRPGAGADQPPPEVFRPTSGRVLGLIGVACGVGLAALGLAVPGSVAPVVMAAGLLGAVLAWAAMLRPGVAIGAGDLVLRNMLETLRIPLIAIEEVAVRQVLAVRTANRRYVSPAIGKSLRQTIRANKTDSVAEDPGSMHYAEFVESRIRHLAEEARTVAGIDRHSEAQAAAANDVRREPAWLEIVLLVATTLVLVVTWVR